MTSKKWISPSAATEQEAARIRRYWLDPRERRYDKYREQLLAAIKPLDQKTPPPGTPMPTKMAVETYKARLGRPLNTSDVGHLAAITMDQWAPPQYTKTRDERKTRRKLQRYMKNPDPSGMSAPDESEWEQCPDLAEQFFPPKKV